METRESLASASPPHTRGGTRVGPRARGGAPGRGLRAPGNDRRGRLVGQGPPWPSHLVGGTCPRGLEGVAEKRVGSNPAGAPRSRPQRRERRERGGGSGPIICHDPTPVRRRPSPPGTPRPPPDRVGRSVTCWAGSSAGRAGPSLMARPTFRTFGPTWSRSVTGPEPRGP